VVLLLAMLGIGGGAYPGFLSLQVLFNLLIDNAFLLVLAIGMGFVILSGGIDLSVGAVLALSTMVTAWLLQTAHWHPALVIAPCWCWARCSARRWGSLIHLFKLQPFIVTLAGMFLARGLCYLISTESITIDQPFLPRCRRPRCRSWAASCRRGRSSRWSCCCWRSGWPTSLPSAAPCMPSAATSSRPR
jgi:ribose/xylose/arabinose/galactoside ABC-type transport system permease subunit